MKGLFFTDSRRGLFLRGLLALGLFYSAQSLASKVPLNPQTKASYLQLLDQAVVFHQALDEGDQQNIQKEIKKTQDLVTQVYQNSLSLPAFHHRIHSYKLLSNIEEQLTGLSSSYSPSQNPNEKPSPTPDKTKVKKLFLSFFELAQVYDLNKEMKGRMFYCPKDRSLWIQSSKKASNPINSQYQSCGKIIL